MNDRSFEFRADGQPFSFSGRAVLEGKDDLSLWPALFRLELYNLPEEQYLLISRAKTLTVSHAGACLVSGQAADTFRRHTRSGTVTEVSLSAGLRLWEAQVSLTVPAGTPVSGTVRRILSASGTGIPLLSPPSPDPASLRPGSYFGRAAECVERALSAADCRGVLTPSGVMPVPKGGLPEAWRLTGRDLLEEPSFAGGGETGAPRRMILTARLAGWRPGQTVDVSCGDIFARGIIIERSIRADTASGEWKSELLTEVIP